MDFEIINKEQIPQPPLRNTRVKEWLKFFNSFDASKAAKIECSSMKEALKIGSSSSGSATRYNIRSHFKRVRDGDKVILYIWKD